LCGFIITSAFCRETSYRCDHHFKLAL
jgi:hypothetical protein